MKAADLLNKAMRALVSARLLLDSGDVDGACNRAYYAMFDAARWPCWLRVRQPRRNSPKPMAV